MGAQFDCRQDDAPRRAGGAGRSNNPRLPRALSTGSATRVILRGTDDAYLGLVPTASAYSGSVENAASIGSLATLADATLTPELHIYKAMALFGANEADDLAVVDARGRVLGMLTEKYVRRRYADELEKAQRELYGED